MHRASFPKTVRALAPSAPSRLMGGTATPVSLGGTTGKVYSLFRGQLLLDEKGRISS